MTDKLLTEKYLTKNILELAIHKSKSSSKDVLVDAYKNRLIETYTYNKEAFYKDWDSEFGEECPHAIPSKGAVKEVEEGYMVLVENPVTGKRIALEIDTESDPEHGITIRVYNRLGSWIRNKQCVETLELRWDRELSPEYTDEVF